MTFEPIAIVGQSCLLPGALDPSALWEAVRHARDLVEPTPPGRWRVSRSRILSDTVEPTFSDRGGYVQGFEERFDPTGFGLPAEDIVRLDPLFQWVLHAGREALRMAGAVDAERAGAVVGNLSFPSDAMTTYAARVWLGDHLADAAGIPKVDARNRFTSGLPAHLLARALSLGGEAFAIDAACASSLYAVKLACDRLHARKADVMLAGAVNRADDLFIHVGFSALSALSRTGQSRPFHREADGLVPAEGAAFVALKRLDDAESAGDEILGVIRAVGLSNDGRGGGFLAPAEAGQLRAMQAAYEMSGVRPDQISLIECHATGTVVGDTAELHSMSRLYDGRSGVPIGSLKSNLGHAITVAGAAGLIKVLQAMRAGVRPPTLHTDAPLEALEGSPFRLLTEEEPWESDGPRMAAVNAFGFGGNNAHLIVEEHASGRGSTAVPAPRRDAVAIVGLGVRIGECTSKEAFEARLAEGESFGRCAELELPLQGLRFPPRDLEQTLPQQLLVLAAAHEALEGLSDLPRERTGVLVGMACDPEIGRYGARWRLADWVETLGHDTDWVSKARDAFVPPLEAAGVLGTMPNIVTNRLNQQFDLAGPSYSISSEEVSGLRALQLAIRSLEVGEWDAAVVGAVDLSRGVVHEKALEDLGLTRPTGDAAVVLVLKRLDDALARKDTVFAVVEEEEPGTESPPWEGTQLTGDAHGALGLVRVAAAALQNDDRTTSVAEEAMEGQSAAVRVSARKTDRPESASTDGPMVSYPGHWPNVRLPERVSVMEPAPPLPSVLEQHWTPEPQPVVVETAVVAAAPAVEPAPVGAVAAFHSSVSEVHRNYLKNQVGMHLRFLEMRTKAVQSLLPVASRSASIAPAPPAPPPSAPVAEPSPPPEPGLPGLKLDRRELEIHASGNISEIFGELFRQQDTYARQVRMPTPPLLLADRVTGIDAEAGSMGTGTVWTETDVTEDAWYLHEGRMPPGLMVEAGQADLLLISYLGADFQNRGRRAYRLLGCQLTYHGELPKPGEVLQYDIHVDRHAQQGEVRLFFFHYDCHVNGELRLSVRDGQAGFFTEEEMRDSDGVLWDAETGERCENPRLDPPVVDTTPSKLSRGQLDAFASGKTSACFGKGYELADTHTRTPKPPGGDMLLLEQVTDLDLQGGAWGRGYLRAIDDIAPDHWFFDGHFYNDPCMPGTLMFEGCLQAMAIYLTALGYTLERDGWRFEPVSGESALLRCRGQVTPQAKQLVYEVFVEEVFDGPEPTLYADLLCTVDGLKAFHCRRMGLKLVPSWPLESRPDLLSEASAKRVATVGGFPFDYKSLMACALGRPSEAFGPMFLPLDGPRRVPRLPGPPYHFISRVTAVDEDKQGKLEAGAVVEVEYDVPPDAWYFKDSPSRTMPFCVLMEAALQPCGWLATYVGSTLTTDEDLFFRNLDGTGTATTEITPTSGTLRTRVKSTNISKAGSVLIESFDVECFFGDEKVYEMNTVFGFFPKESLEEQTGLPAADDVREAVTAENDFHVDLTAAPARYCGGTAALPSPFLMMIDRITGYWPDGGEKGLGRFRSEKDVESEDWYFRAHFFQDPVQPGSLGVEAMLQVLQFAMLEKGMSDGINAPRFQALALSVPVTWKYRGQVRVHNERVTTILDIEEEGVDEHGAYATARASLWVDGICIYEASNLGMRIVPGGERPSAPSSTVETLDPVEQPWWRDHCPTWTVPALPLMSLVDRIVAAGNAGGRVIGLKDALVRRWLVLPEAVTLSADVDGSKVVLRSGDEPVAEGTVLHGDAWPEQPEPLPPLTDAEEAEDPYETAGLFHGPAFRVLRWLRVGSNGASAILDATVGDVPVGALNQALLDGATHAIPHDALSRWSSEISDDDVAYPVRITELMFHGPTPTEGEVRCETRFDGFYATSRFPAFRVQLIHGDRVWVSFRLVEALFPKGPIGRAEPVERRAFLRDQVFVEGVGLSRTEDGATKLLEADVAGSDWLPGTMAATYGTTEPEAIAHKEHLAGKVKLHPRRLPDALPLNTFPVSTERSDGEWVIRDTGPERLDITSVREFWTEWFDRGPWPVEDLYYSLIERFVRRFIVVDPAAFDEIRGKNVLYLCNHQVGIESLLFSILVGGFSRVPTVTLAKIEHQKSWLGTLIQHCFSYPGVEDPGTIRYFDRSDKASLPNILKGLAVEMVTKGRSASIHIEGTRSLTCRKPVEKMSGMVLDLALKANLPVVPVRFIGGLPVEPLESRIEFPIGLGSQDYWIGAPIPPATLSALDYAERKNHVIRSINALGPDNSIEEPNPPGDAAFVASVESWVKERGARYEDAVLFRTLENAAGVCDATRKLLDTAHGGRLDWTDSDEDVWVRALADKLLGTG